MDALAGGANGHGTTSVSNEDRGSVEGVASEWAADDGFDALEELFMRERVVTCGNPGGLYELWGLEALELASSTGARTATPSKCGRGRHPTLLAHHASLDSPRFISARKVGPNPRRRRHRLRSPLTSPGF